MSPKSKTPKKKKITRKSDEKFVIPAGAYRAQLNKATHVEEGANSHTRFIYKIISDELPDKMLLVEKIYSDRDLKEFLRDIQSWLSEDQIAEGLRTPWVTKAPWYESLVGTHADIILVHRINPENEGPSYYIQKVLPPGKLVRVGLN